MAKRSRSLRGVRLHWDELPDRQPFLRAATIPVDTEAQSPHAHDYYEIFWVDSGSVLQYCNEIARTLATGDLCFIRPDDVHSISGRGAQITSCAIPVAEHDRLRAAYGTEGPWPWDAGVDPLVVHIGPSGLATLADVVAANRHGDLRRSDLDWFVLTVLRATRVRGANNPSLPTWLSDAVSNFRERGDLIKGISMLVRQTGRGHAYVSRCVRRFYGLDLTGLVNGIRLEKAAHLLRRTDHPIPTIAAMVGLPNVSNFYKHFHKRFGLTPKTYRRHGAVGARKTGLAPTAVRDQPGLPTLSDQDFS